MLAMRLYSAITRSRLLALPAATQLQQLNRVAKPGKPLNALSWSAALVNDTVFLVVVVTECEKWCTKHDKPWAVKCTWSKICGGCSECSGAS